MLSTGPLNLKTLDDNYCCVVSLASQNPAVLFQVTLRPDKIKDNLIRLGETTGDEASGWQYGQAIEVRTILGKAKEENDKTWTVEPLLKSVG